MMINNGCIFLMINLPSKSQRGKMK